MISTARCSGDFDHQVHGARNAGAPGSPNHPHPTLSRSTGRGNRLRPLSVLHLIEDTAVPAGAKAVPTTAPTSRPAEVFKDKDGRPYPPLEQLAQRAGDAKAGEKVFRGDAAGCFRCHQVGDEGGMIGPPLTVIGDK